MQISVKHDVREIAGFLNNLRGNILPQATSRAINRTADQTKTQAVKEIAGSWGYQQKEVREKIAISRANKSRLIAVLRASGKPISLYKHAKGRVKQLPNGVSVRLPGQTLFYAGAYIATMPTGHIGIYRTKGGRRGKPKRVKGGINIGKLYQSGLPIKELFAPSITTAFRAKKTMDLMQQTIKERFPINFKHELQFASNK